MKLTSAWGSLIPPFLKYSLIAALFLGAWGLHTYDKIKAVRQAEIALIAEYEKELSDAATAARESEQKMQREANQLRQTKDEQIKAINSKLAVALNELRTRPERPSDPAKDTGDTKACTGAFLYREDAEFLTREASRADSVLAERDYYYSQYESVRRRLDEATP